MTNIIIASECKSVTKGRDIYIIEPTYRDEGGMIVLGQDQYRCDEHGNIIGFEHFDVERARWQ